MSDSAQGSAVSFCGTAIGKLTGYRIEAGQIVQSDFTSAESSKFGTGQDVRVMKEVGTSAIEPGRVELTLIGVPPFQISDIGKRGALAVSLSGGYLNAEAILATFDVEGSVGELLKGQVSFVITGNT